MKNPKKKSKTFNIESKQHFLDILDNKVDFYKFLIDNYKDKVVVDIPTALSSLHIKMNNQNLTHILEYFVQKEEYEYANKTKKILG